MWKPISFDRGCLSARPWYILIHVSGSLILRFVSRRILKRRTDDPPQTARMHPNSPAWHGTLNMDEKVEQRALLLIRITFQTRCYATLQWSLASKNKSYIQDFPGRHGPISCLSGRARRPRRTSLLLNSESDNDVGEAFRYRHRIFKVIGGPYSLEVQVGRLVGKVNQTIRPPPHQAECDRRDIL